MKKWLFVFLIVLYLTQIFPLAFLVDVGSDTHTYNIPGGIYTFFAFLVLSIVLAVINIVSAVKSLKINSESETKKPLKTIMWFKLGLIPFFIIHFFIWVIAMGSTANPFLMVLWVIIPAIFFIYAYMVLLATSSYPIIQIIKMCRRGVFTKGKCAFHIIMQLLFFADVVDTVCLFFKYRKVQ